MKGRMERAFNRISDRESWLWDRGKFGEKEGAVTFLGFLTKDKMIWVVFWIISVGFGLFQSGFGSDFGLFQSGLGCFSSIASGAPFFKAPGAPEARLRSAWTMSPRLDLLQAHWASPSCRRA